MLILWKSHKNNCNMAVRMSPDLARSHAFYDKSLPLAEQSRRFSSYVYANDNPVF